MVECGLSFAVLRLSLGAVGDRSMLAKLKTFSLLGIDALPVEVEVDVSPSGLPKTVLVGTRLAQRSQSLIAVSAHRRRHPG